MLEAFRPVSLIKEVRVRPIGRGEVLGRIIGNCISQLLRKDILNASGTLQTCSGLESGVEVAIMPYRTHLEVINAKLFS